MRATLNTVKNTSLALCIASAIACAPLAAIAGDSPGGAQGFVPATVPYEEPQTAQHANTAVEAANAMAATSAVNAVNAVNAQSANTAQTAAIAAQFGSTASINASQITGSANCGSGQGMTSLTGCGSAEGSTPSQSTGGYSNPCEQGAVQATITAIASSTYIVPAGVTSICLVPVGGGGYDDGSGNLNDQGGDAAALSTPVTPGQVISVFVGRGDNGGPGAQNSTASIGNLTVTAAHGAQDEYVQGYGGSCSCEGGTGDTVPRGASSGYTTLYSTKGVSDSAGSALMALSGINTSYGSGGGGGGDGKQGAVFVIY